MADFNIQPVGTQIRPVQGMSLGEMVNMARGVQEYQQAQQLNPVQLQAAQQQLQTAQQAYGQAQQLNPIAVEQARQELFRLQQLTPEQIKQAQAEAQRATTEAGVSSLTAMPRVGAARSQEQTAAAQAQQAKLATYGAFLKNARTETADLLKRPEISYDDIVNSFKTAVENSGADEDSKKQVLAQGLSGIPKGLKSDQYRSLLAQQLVKTVSDESRLSSLFPSIQMLGTGQQALPITGGSALAIQPAGVPTGAPGIPMQPPPTTQTVSPTGQTQLIGTLPQGPYTPAPQAVTGLPPSQSAVLAAGGEVIKEDLPRTVSEAREAPQRIAIFQNIKKLTPDAFTGPTAERRQTVASFAQMLGIPVATLETASTDELAKNTKLLQLAGGNTDAARALAEFANPNTKMTKEGITRVTNQLLSLEAMKLARANYLLPVQNDAGKYMQRKQDFDSVSDPRLFQEMSREDAQKMWNAMSASERQKIVEMRNKARALGVIK